MGQRCTWFTLQTRRECFLMNKLFAFSTALYNGTVSLSDMHAILRGEPRAPIGTMFPFLSCWNWLSRTNHFRLIQNVINALESQPSDPECNPAYNENFGQTSQTGTNQIIDIDAAQPSSHEKHCSSRTVKGDSKTQSYRPIGVKCTGKAKI